jgi:hypothetical protein
MLLLATFAWAPAGAGPLASWATELRSPADFLRHNYPEPQPVLPQPPIPPTGGVLVRTRGCLECHRLGVQGPRAGVDLYAVGRHMSAETIERLLLDPREVNPEATMPQPALTRAEALVIAKFLARLR